MARIYIAARFSRRPEANRLAHVLQAAGHHITSRWVRPDCDRVLPTGLSARAADAIAREVWQLGEGCFDADNGLRRLAEWNGGAV